jgi:hypothetical protein
LKAEGIKSIRLVTDEDSFDCEPPYVEAPFVNVKGWKCACGSVAIRSREKNYNHDEVYGAAHCVACGEKVGTLRVKVSTLFGIEEDIAVLNGRCRVY